MFRFAVLAMAGNILEELEFNAGDLIKVSEKIRAFDREIYKWVYGRVGYKEWVNTVERLSDSCQCTEVGFSCFLSTFLYKHI